MGSLSTLWDLLTVVLGPDMPLTESRKVCGSMESVFGRRLVKLPRQEWAKSLQKLHALTDEIIACAALEYLHREYLHSGSNLLARSNGRFLQNYCELEFKREPSRGAEVHPNRISDWQAGRGLRPPRFSTLGPTTISVATGVPHGKETIHGTQTRIRP